MGAQIQRRACECNQMDQVCRMARFAFAWRAAAYTRARMNSRRAMVFVIGVSLMNAVATMLIIPVLPRLVTQFTGDTGSAAHYVGLFATVFALTQFLMSPVLGSLSDRYGRRPII